MKEKDQQYRAYVPLVFDYCFFSKNKLMEKKKTYFLSFFVSYILVI